MNVIVVFDIDGVVRDVSGSYRRALADTVEHYTGGEYRPTSEDIDRLKAEGTWNNDWEGSQAERKLTSIMKPSLLFSSPATEAQTRTNAMATSPPSHY